MADDRPTDTDPAFDREAGVGRGDDGHDTDGARRDGVEPSDADAVGSSPQAQGPDDTRLDDASSDREDPVDGGKTRRSSGGSFLRELPVLLVIALVLAFLLRTFVLQVFYIPSSSMEPTLQIDDRMVVEKVTYLFREPRRGEVVVFEGDAPVDPDPDASLATRVVSGFGQFIGLVPASAKDFVKRVVGLPGDEVVLEDGQVFVNGEPLDEPYARLDQSDFGPVTVPEDSLFFLGDNRANSSDSRRSLGFVPMDQVVGRSVLILWPFDHAGMLTGVDYELPDSTGVPDDGEMPDTPDGAVGRNTVELDAA